MQPKADEINLPGKDTPTKDEPMAYPAGEDIYKKSHEEKNIDPENTDQNKEILKADTKGIANEKDFEETVFETDMDVPGSELDDEQEAIGSEDEENNYYSLGGDNHNDLEEDKGE